MLTKQELLNYLKRALEGEEKSIPIYMSHLESAVFWLGLDKKIADKAKEEFLFLAKQSIRHKKIVAGMIKKISEEKKDAF